jgi:hypothetical protein
MTSGSSSEHAGKAEKSRKESRKEGEKVNVSELRSDWKKFEDKRVQLDGQVQQVYGSDAFMLGSGSSGNGVLVVTRSKEQKRAQNEQGGESGQAGMTGMAPVAQGDQVQIEGKVKSMSLKDVQSRYHADLSSQFPGGQSEKIPVVETRQRDIHVSSAASASGTQMGGTQGSEAGTTGSETSTGGTSTDMSGTAGTGTSSDMGGTSGTSDTGTSSGDMGGTTGSETGTSGSTGSSGTGSGY